MKDRERDLLRKTILELLMKGKLCWSDLQKKVLGSCQPFATDATFSRQMRYLVRRGFVKKHGKAKSRAPYEITEKGKRLLSLLE